MTPARRIHIHDRRVPHARLLLATLLLALSTLLVAVAPAHALSQRGHEFKLSFGASGESGTTLSKPGDIVVSAKTGDVYVLDRNQNRIVQYAPELIGGKLTGYKFGSAWGWGVKSGGAGTEYERCSAGESCKAGIAGRGEYQFNAYVLGIAIDNCTVECAKDPSAGDIYVLKESASKAEDNALTLEEEITGEHAYSEYAAIAKFNPEGEELERTTERPNNHEFKYEGGCTKAGEKAAYCTEGLLNEGQDAEGVTVGPEGTVWLDYESVLFPLGDASLTGTGEPSERRKPLSPSLSGEVTLGLLAEDARNHFYIGQQLTGPTDNPLNVISAWEVVKNEAGEEELTERGGGEEPLEALDFEETTGVTANQLDVSENEVDEQNDVYITNAKTEQGTKSSTVAQFAPSGKLIQRFSATGGIREAAGVAVNPATGTVYATDAASNSNDIDVFTLEEPRAPIVDSVAAQDVTGESAKLEAQIDPGGAETHYSFRYAPGPVPGAGEACNAPCVETPKPEEEIVRSWGDKAVSAYLQKGTGAPLAPDTVYHYRVIAKNDHGEGEREGSFRTSAEAAAEGEADGRIWEMVSPAKTNGANVGVINEEPDGLMQAAANGGAITYVTSSPVGEAEGSRTYEVTQLLSERGVHGWESQDIVTPNEHATSLPIGQGSGLPGEYQFFSEDLSLAIVHPFVPEDFGKGAEVSNLAEPPLSPPVTEAEKGKQERTIYVRDNKPIAPAAEAETKVYEEAEANGQTMDNPGYVALLTEANLPGAEFGTFSGAPSFLDANPDLSTAVVSIGGGKGEKEGLYAWSEGVLKAVSVQPEGVEPVPGSLGAGQDKRHAISNDGFRIFWSSNGHLYMRATKTPSGDSALEETIQLDKAQGVAEPERGGAQFQTASAEGSLVFFTDTKPLTQDSGGEGTSDLYVCKIVENTTTHKFECDLTDLTPRHETRAHEKESADVQGMVLGASEDGAYVYFVADGVLSEPANSEGEHAQPGLCGNEGFPETTCNLYVDHYSGEHARWETTFIAALSEEDAPDWESLHGSNEELERITSRVSPNGLYLAFMSDRELTGYDTVDSHPQADGAHDEEVFEYAASAAEEAATPGGLVCASCNPSGAQPSGVFDQNGREEEEGKTKASLAVDRPEIWAKRWLAGSVPGWTSLAAGSGAEPYAIYQSRYLSDSGRLFFDSPERLVAGATNGVEDVYEYEPTGVPRGSHECTTQSATYSESVEGCIGLISSPTATGEAVFIDASESGGEGPHGEELQEGGGDVFFVSGAKLAPQDKEGTLTLYDAHECTAASSCILTPLPKETQVCQSAEACRPYTPPGSLPAGPATGSPGASGNLNPQHSVLPSKASAKSKSLTRAQKLAKALKTCRTAHKHSRKKRLACEKQARKRYAPAKKAEKARKSDHVRTRVERTRPA